MRSSAVAFQRGPEREPGYGQPPANQLLALVTLLPPRPDRGEGGGPPGPGPSVPQYHSPPEPPVPLLPLVTLLPLLASFCAGGEGGGVSASLEPVGIWFGLIVQWAFAIPCDGAGAD